MKLTKVIMAAVMLLALPANAGNLSKLGLEDPEVIAPAAPMARFDGPYVMLGAGIAGSGKLKFNSEESDNETKDAFADYSFRSHGSAELGYRWQRGKNVYGVSVASFLNVGEASFHCDDIDYLCKGGVDIGATLALSYGRTFGRSDNNLLFGKIGAAYVSGSMWHKRLAPGHASGTEWSHNYSKVAPVVGIGYQHLFRNGVFVGLEGDYVFSGVEQWNVNVWGPHDHTFRSGSGVSSVSLTVGYQF